MKRWLMLFALLGATAFAAEAKVDPSGHIESPGVDIRVFRTGATEPLFGSISKSAAHVRFAATLPLVPGETYRVEVQSPDGHWTTQQLHFQRPAAAAPAASISPAPTSLPANALKLYLHFSQPMEQGVFLDRITLLRHDGSIVQGAFRETELWSPDGRRLTLWLHPGRQKTGVNLNQDEGPVLQENSPYTLKIASSWRSTAGVALGKDITFPITAAAPDHTCPDPLRWQITPPKAATRDPLTITFDEPLDPAILVSALTVKARAATITGSAHVASDARTWSFTPASVWPSGAGLVEIDPLLEDLAGNNLLGPFEVDRDAPENVAKKSTLDFQLGD
ncbi:Ig-like domain-containing protein [Prosthecobacter fluviatilis]|uniref:Ig-like domain-containing protein n=1 Tax=Prosthecobacter fluviatilis TaxID=445931 RepID=A0ABW0KL71_9BACT